ncbi:uncharacterized protein KY384_006782 [Bacidia gigantensis]|uniref:uncharacterized protein n=1 Tax=Bacidia gigantensis TaxID=2732470 RepID=UPI001D05B38A|nr:uncharacterized protein KY384_006782 [Bacidia gigantensis]KAG8527866.1 hypothetical protein KY384_006782 [Bacidia gigantensis]
MEEVGRKDEAATDDCGSDFCESDSGVDDLTPSKRVSQDPEGKDARDSKSLPARHLESPDYDHGNEQDHKVGDHVDRASSDKDRFVIDAMAGLERVPQLASRYTWPDLDWDVRQIEEEIEQDDPLYGPVRL